MRLHLTGHVIDELSERGVERQWVERVATEPEWIEPSRARAGVDLRFGRIEEAGGKVLRVTTIDEGMFGGDHRPFRSKGHAGREEDGCA
jgi:hypothetical protein